ncbi:MAG: hypothetical protein JWN02_629, partial [Acidobacteria bacterium]|nr:hypothetical protein [Acidobacteriota bacterium]
NPPYGAVFTYYLKDELKSRRKQRWAAETKIEKDGGNEPAKQQVPFPTLEQIRAEQRELDPAVVLTVSDEQGTVVRRVAGSVKGGFHRLAWDLRFPPPSPIDLKEPELDPFNTPPTGPLVAPGLYSARLTKRIDGVETPIGEAQTFSVVPLYASIMKEGDRAGMLEFQKRAAHLQRDLMGVAKTTADALTRIQYIRRALDEIEGSDPKLVARVNALDATLHDIDDQLNGDPATRTEGEPNSPTLLDRVNTAVNGLATTVPPTQTARQALASAEKDAGPLTERLRVALTVELPAIEAQLNALGAPWTPGRIPQVK